LIKANVAAAAPNSSFDAELSAAPMATLFEATVMAATSLGPGGSVRVESATRIICGDGISRHRIFNRTGHRARHVEMDRGEPDHKQVG
jgi:hypothetical protein